jgi:hypothetical protein
MLQVSRINFPTETVPQPQSIEKDEWKFVIKFFRMKGFSAKPIQGELSQALGRSPYKQSQIKVWLRTFIVGDLSCQDLERPGGPLLVLRYLLESLQQQFPVARAQVIAQHFFATLPSGKEILRSESGME